MKNDINKSNNSYSEEVIDIYDILLPIWKGWKLIISICSIGIAISIIISLIMTQLYSAEATILPISSSTNMRNNPDLMNMGLFSSLSLDDNVNRILAVLRSRTIKENVIKRMKLIDIILEEKPKKRSALYATVTKLMTMTKINYNKDNDLIKVSVIFKNPEIARDISNMYIEELNNILHFSSNLASKKKLKFLEEQMKDVEIKLNQQKKELVKFQKKTKIIEPVHQSKWTMNIYTDLISKRTELQVRLQKLETALAPGNPQVKELKNQLRIINNKINRIERHNKVGELPSLKNAPENISKYTELVRKLQITETIYETMSKLYEQTKFEEAHEGLYVQIIDAAIKPEVKTIPRRRRIVSIAAIASLIFSIFMVYFLDWIKKIRDIHVQKNIY